MRVPVTTLVFSALFAAPAHADGLSITICDATTIDVIQDALELEGYTLLDPSAPCVQGVGHIDAADQGPGYTAEVLPPWRTADVEVVISAPTPRAVVMAAIVAQGRVPPSGPGIIQFTETYDVGPIPIK